MRGLARALRFSTPVPKKEKTRVTCMHVHVCMYVCMYVRTYVYIYMYIQIVFKHI